MVKKSDKTLFAFITTFFSLLGFVIAILAWRKNDYIMHYAKISLVFFIFSFIAGILSSILAWIPVLGWIITAGLNVLVFVAWLVSWIHALSGEKKEIPFISEFAKKIKL